MIKFNGRKALLLGAAVLSLGLAATSSAFAEHGAGHNPVVGGSEMFPTKNIVENASMSADHTTLVAAVKAADLVETLQSEGPFTVFAPTNAAFEKLPEGTVANLLKPENKAMLTKILTYHVVPGKLVASDIEKLAAAHDGKAVVKTVQGEEITAMKDKDGKWWVVDATGGKAEITVADVGQSNGTIFVIDTVLMPKPEKTSN